ncbi:hypothetical protein RF11_07967 [Thelohanellus kitauei]|uniref:Uncharacterized protein n=1 Tax=Thelohanellus kitauei TaxID=669202 RepID=A0A0C2JQT6_THEKT|nr:hypothetical protein RF11_07967 [Thelohanellus kitauei]
MALRLGAKWNFEKFIKHLKWFTSLKRHNIPIVEEIRQRYHDHYFHHNNYVKSLLIHTLRHEYGKLIKMDYIDDWDYKLEGQTVSLSKSYRNEDICASFDINDDQFERIFLNCPEPVFYTDFDVGRLRFYSQNIICIPVVKITFTKPCGKLIMEVDYVSRDYPVTLKPCFIDSNDNLPYVLFNESGKPLVEITSIAMYDSSNKLIYSHDNRMIVEGLSDFWITYLKDREIDENFFKKILNMSYRVDMDLYIQFLQHFIRYFPYKRDYENMPQNVSH